MKSKTLFPTNEASCQEIHVGSYKTINGVREIAVVPFPLDDKYAFHADAMTFNDWVGTWKLIKFSGAMHGSKKREIISRIDIMIRAAKEARERANLAVVEEREIGEQIFNYILKGNVEANI